MVDCIPINDQTWLVCGGRDFADQKIFDEVMGYLLRTRGCPSKVVHGGALGADSMAVAWAERMAIQVAEYPADWKAYGPSAGPIRNQEMLDKETPQIVIAFPGGRGTADMVRRAKEAPAELVEIKPNRTGDKG